MFEVLSVMTIFVILGMILVHKLPDNQPKHH
jgi:hypothetical protein